MLLRDKVYLVNVFKRYYYTHSKDICRSIRDFESREFAYVDFDNIMRRHIALSESTFVEWILNNVPRHFYYSSSYYLFPSKEMGEKGWLGADLIFDIDIDHIKGYSPHKIIVCVEDEELVIKESSSECKGTIEEVSFFTEADYLIAKKELSRLVSILIEDFGIETKDIKIYFSGARGFHVHVESEALSKLDSYARMEIKDYLTFSGIDIKEVKSMNARPMKELFLALTSNDERSKGIFTTRELNYLRKLMNNYEKFISALKRNKRLLRKVNRFLVEHLSISIDDIVTVDTSRLIRVPLSIHGKTGLIKTYVPLEKIDTFNPFNESILPLFNKVKLKVRYLPRLIWSYNEYGPYYNEEVILPEGLAVSLLLRNLGYHISFT
ncbi:MAG: DNA primase small subunit domain-containing protein [Candidatus Geothermarchaeota archaeon]